MQPIAQCTQSPHTHIAVPAPPYSSATVADPQSDRASQKDDEADDNINPDWYIPPDDITARVVLPDGFPPPQQKRSDAFTKDVITADIDRFHHMDYDHSLFVYKGFIRTVYRRYLFEDSRTTHGKNKTL